MKTDTKSTLTIPQFCERECITIRRAKRTDSNPNMDDSVNMDHWVVQLSIRSPKDRHGRTMTIHFSMGYGHGGKQPDVEEVMNALVSDFVDDSASFEDWCAEIGYDTDSRKAERTFKACQKETKNLRRFLGDDRLNELLYEVERL